MVIFFDQRPFLGWWAIVFLTPKPSFPYFGETPVRGKRVPSQRFSYKGLCLLFLEPIYQQFPSGGGHSGSTPTVTCTVDAETITKIIPQTIFVQRRSLHKFKEIPRIYFGAIGWQLQDLIAHRNAHYTTQINSPENILCICNGLHFTNSFCGK